MLGTWQLEAEAKLLDGCPVHQHWLQGAPSSLPGQVRGVERLQRAAKSSIKAADVKQVDWPPQGHPAGDFEDLGLQDSIDRVNPADCDLFPCKGQSAFKKGIAALRRILDKAVP